MHYESVMAALPDEARAAIQELEKIGFSVFLQAKIDDTQTAKDDALRMTYANAGRYHLVIAAKNIDTLQVSEKRGPGRPKKST